MSAPRIVFEDVRKTFRRGNRSDALRDALPRLALRALGRGTPPPPRFTALDGVSFEVASGEVVGLVGANGAGKSTSLRLAAGVYRPDTGRVRVDGRVSALIELSAGFHPDLSGRENIELVGALHGLRRREIVASLGDIAAFADIGEFLDAPVRTYSTGMAVRLGFAVSVNVPAEILLVDEVLAVGDAEFQAKCLRRMAERRDAGVTILFVSHNLQVMEQFCDRILFVHHGHLLADGAPAETVSMYRRKLAEEAHGSHGDGARRVRLRRGTHELRIEDVVLDDGAGGAAGVAAHRGTLRVRATWSTTRPVARPRLRLRFHTVDAALCGAAPAAETEVPEVLDGSGTLEVLVRDLPFLAGAYDVTIEARDDSGLVLLDQHDRLYALTVVGARPSGAEGVVHVPAAWTIRGAGD